MKSLYIKSTAQKLGLQVWQVENCFSLFEEGNTIPFISRYRKEQTGGMDDDQVSQCRHYMDIFNEMEKRKAGILQTIEKAGALSPELKKKIENCTESTELEDLYLPYRPKRRTRATVAKELGLEGLAEKIWSLKALNPLSSARAFISEGVADEQAALSGARDIIAERLSEQPAIREALRKNFRRAKLEVELARGAKDKEETDKYRSYIGFNRPLDKIPSHNLLAILRASNEGIFTVKLVPFPETEEQVYRVFCRQEGRPGSRALDEEIRSACEDSYDRLLSPSITNEVLKEAKAKADEESVRVFSDNLRQLLLEAPVGEKVNLAIDPGFRNGCKCAVGLFHYICLGDNGNPGFVVILRVVKSRSCNPGGAGIGGHLEVQRHSLQFHTLAAQHILTLGVLPVEDPVNSLFRDGHRAHVGIEIQFPAKCHVGTLHCTAHGRCGRAFQ